MGCWNHTCAVTNLPVFEYEPVVVIMLRKTTPGFGSSFCYPSEYHNPLPLTFTGKYNDYGSVEDCEGPALDTIVRCIRNDLIEMELGENQYHDIEVKKDGFDVAKMFEADHEGRLCVRNYLRPKETSPLNHIVVKSEVYDAIVRTMTLRRWDKERGSYEMAYDDVIAEIPQYIDDLTEIACDDEPDLLKNKRFGCGLSGRIGTTFIAELMSRDHHSGFYDMSDPISVLEELLDIAETRDIDKLKGVLENAIQFQFFMRFMDTGRMSFHVPSGRGSQSGDTVAQELRATLTLQEAEKIKHQWDEE